MKTITLYYKLLSQKDKKAIIKALRIFKKKIYAKVHHLAKNKKYSKIC